MEGQGTELNVYRTINRVKKLQDKNPNEKTWLFFVDFSKAYDRVDHNILFEKM